MLAVVRVRVSVRARVRFRVGGGCLHATGPVCEWVRVKVGVRVRVIDPKPNRWFPA